jgi:hypothetical protein
MQTESWLQLVAPVYTNDREAGWQPVNVRLILLRLLTVSEP